MNNTKRIYSNDTYSIYQINTIDGESYYISLPTNMKNNLTMTIDFKEEYYNALLKNEIIEQIKDRCKKLYKINPNIIYILPNVSTYDLSIALTENDNKSYEHIFNSLQKYVSNSYHILTSNNINISQIITIITETSDDKKFMHWLELTKQGFFQELDINKVLENDNIRESNQAKNRISTENTNNKPKSKVLIPKNNKHGYTNILFIIISLSLLIVFSIGIAIIIYFKIFI